MKIRGFLVELSEIELRIRACPEIKDAAVVPLDAPGGGKCAVAYVVSDTNVDVEKLNRFIEMELPAYMVPAAVVQVDAIPINANGKVDRKKLPQPEFGAVKQGSGLDDAGPEDAKRPANDLETAIREILTDVLGHGRFNLHTNLLRAGLTSLSAIRFCARLDERIGAAPPVPEIMKSPTMLDIENAILRKLLNKRISAAVFDEGKAEGTAGYPLSQSQAGVYFECMKRPDSTIYNIPFRISFHPAANGAPLDTGRLARAAAAVIDAHPTVKSRLGEVSLAEGNVEIRQFPVNAPAEVSCRDAGDDELDGIVRDFVRPFNLFEGPLYRAQVVNSPSGTTLLADFHHIAFDGSSLDVFLRDLEAVFEDEEFLRKNRSAREKISCFDWAVREKHE